MTLLRRAGAFLRARLIPDVRRAGRFISIRLAAIGVVLELLLETGVLDRLLPGWVGQRATMVLFAAIILGRVVAQRDGDDR